MKILVTGGTSRLGKALVEHFCKEGHDVHFTYFSSRENAARLQSASSARGHELDLAQLDLSAASSFLKETIGDDLDALINNSSIFLYDEPGHVRQELFEQSYKVNLRAPTFLLEAFRLLGNAERPRIGVNILDAKIRALNPDYFSYTVMKAGLSAVTRMYGMSSNAGLKVYGVAPAMFAESGPRTVGRVDELTRKNPLDYSLSADDVVRAIDLCMSGVQKSGEILLIDAGQTLMGFDRDVAYLSS